MYVCYEITPHEMWALLQLAKFKVKVSMFLSFLDTLTLYFKKAGI